MILIIAGTNREGSNTAMLTRAYAELVAGMTEEEVKTVFIHDLQEGLLHKDMYEDFGQKESLVQVQNELFIPAAKWIIVSPEYNGSFPGVVKLFLDALSARNAEETFKNTKVALVGLSSGRTGNWLGMNHLTGILNYLKMNVFYNKVAINHISQYLDDEGKLVGDKIKKTIKEQFKAFLEF